MDVTRLNDSGDNVNTKTTRRALLLPLCIILSLAGPMVSLRDYHRINRVIVKM